MNIEAVREYCLTMKGAEESFPFDDTTLVFKVLGKIFAVLSLERPDCVTLKCHPSFAEELRSRFNAVSVPRYFCKTTWNEVTFNADADDATIFRLITHAYGETLRNTPKKSQIAFLSNNLPDDIAYIHLNVCGSTMEEARNTLLDGKRCVLISTDLQRAGRGQRGNHWESENGKNLMFSMIFNPRHLHANKQFILSQIAAIALSETCKSVLEPELRSLITIKWPNDIYFEDQKLAGMLLEHDIKQGYISRTSLGIGLNVNQRIFRSDAPNPVSLSLISGYDFPRFLLLESFMKNWTTLMANSYSQEKLHEIYLQNMYRRNSEHSYRDAGGCFMATIDDVCPDGRLILKLSDGETRSYTFKEVVFV